MDTLSAVALVRSLSVQQCPVTLLRGLIDWLSYSEFGTDPAQRAGIVSVMSGTSLIPMEEVARACGMALGFWLHGAYTFADADGARLGLVGRTCRRAIGRAAARHGQQERALARLLHLARR